MSTSITLTGSLTMQSTNGDAPQLLTEAAEFVNALAQLGVTVGVRIELAPVAASPAANPPPSVRLLADGPQLADGALKQLLPGSVMPIPNAPLDPTPAAPAQPDEPLARISDFHGLIRKLDQGAVKFKALPPDTQEKLVEDLGVGLTAQRHGELVSKDLWNAEKPVWMPTAHALAYWRGGRTWPEWQARFRSLFETTTATPSGE